MKKRISDKLRSRTGASISFALLLFLVCAVLSSVAISAATAAAGRMSRLAEIDRRYYAVSSAGGLLAGRIGGNPVTLVRVTESRKTITYTDGVPGEPEEEEGDTVRLYLVDKAAGAVTAEDLVEENLVPEEGGIGDPSKSSLLHDAAYRLCGAAAAGGEETQRTFLLTSDVMGASVNVTILETLAGDGTLTFDIRNTEGSGGAGTYTQKMTFTPTVSRENSRKTEKGAPTEAQDTGTGVTYSVTETTTETGTTSVFWTLSGVENVTASPAEPAPGP